jgi:hypothetical protein
MRQTPWLSRDTMSSSALDSLSTFGILCQSISPWSFLGLTSCGIDTMQSLHHIYLSMRVLCQLKNADDLESHAIMP